MVRPPPERAKAESRKNDAADHAADAALCEVDSWKKVRVDVVPQPSQDFGEGL
jgi:hypothetical protein